MYVVSHSEIVEKSFVDLIKWFGNWSLTCTLKFGKPFSLFFSCKQLYIFSQLRNLFQIKNLGNWFILSRLSRWKRRNKHENLCKSLLRIWYQGLNIYKTELKIILWNRHFHKRSRERDFIFYDLTFYLPPTSLYNFYFEYYCTCLR